jgi:hypothetical protein
MGVVYEDLYDHEGYASGRSSRDHASSARGRQTVDAYEAACSCGWNGTHDYPLTEEGRELAILEWESEHAFPLLELAVPASVATAVEEAERAIRDLAGCRPRAARQLLERHARYIKAVENGLAADEAARRLDLATDGHGKPGPVR